MTYTLGSLFDGSGGFPLAGALCGIVPKWAAEVEPYPIAVTRSRFPNMKHFGDVSKINGAEIEPVDVITFGSPCQDLSVAGKRAGLKHEANGDEETTRSGLFMEAVRIIKEMRRATDGKYPSFALWENVPGAFSSNGGEDFRTVCEELIKIVEPTAAMPEVPANGWAYADSYVGDGWSLSYRVFDAQYWGVPQRRRRIHLVLDLRGERAREVLFEREGLRGYFEAGRTPWQGIASDAEGGSGADDREGNSRGSDRGRGLDAVAYSFDSLASNSMKSSNPHSGCRAVEISKTLDTTNPDPSKNQGGIAIVETLPTCIIDSIGGNAERGWEGEVAPCLKASHHKFPPVITQAAGFCTEHSAKAYGIGYQEEVAPTLRAGVTPAVMAEVYDARGNGDGKTVNTLTGDHNNRVTDYSSVVADPILIHDQATRYATKRGGKADGKGNGMGVGLPGDPMNTLTAADRHGVAYATDVGFFTSLENISPTLLARMYKDPHLVSYPRNELILIARRLTPTECARLQGFADRWGWIDKKANLTDEEYQFWLDVRNTHAAINGREKKAYTIAQMLNWYNKLHTDSAEYKMWGNGIALPPALYCMQGVTDALITTEEADAWLD